jgi:hypothetical protein
VDVLLKNSAGHAAEVELEFVGCAPATVALHLKLDGKPLRSDQVAAGPVGLNLMSNPTRLPLATLPAFVSPRPPPLLPSSTPRVHLWLGSSYEGDMNLDAGSDPAARLADRMLRDAGYSKGPDGPPRPRPRP